MPEDEQQRRHLLNSATIGPDDQELTVVFTGSPPSLFYYEAAVLESESAVTVMPLPRLIAELPDGAAIAPLGILRQVSATLSRPLGSRALVDNDGSPVAVLRRI